MKGYTSKTKIEDYTGETIVGTDIETAVEAWIESVESYIDNETHRNFVAVEETRYYSGTGKSKLIIDDAVSLTTVKKATDVYGEELTTIDSDDYIVVPKDHTERNEPIHVIHLKNDYWAKGQQNHEITAKFGYSESAPDDVELAATILVGMLLNQNQSPDISGKKSEKIGQYSVTYAENGDIKQKFDKVGGLLAPYIDYIF